MKFQFIANACGIFETGSGTRILCDPWLEDGVFEGSWCHYPPLSTRVADVMDVDAVYVSHIHPDHFDERCLGEFPRETPIVVLDHGANFLAKSLQRLDFQNLIRVASGATVRFRDAELSLFAPFAKHCFHEASVGNLIDSALLIRADGVAALNTNDNRPTPEACRALAARYGRLDLAMLNYNAAGPYPSCFENLTEEQKRAESQRIIRRNLDYMARLVRELGPRAVLPFAGAYVLGGRLAHKNPYLGTTTWDRAADHLRAQDLGCEVLTLREGQILDLTDLTLDSAYERIDESDMARYIAFELAGRSYPHDADPQPDEAQLFTDVERAARAMGERAERLGLKSSFAVTLEAFDQTCQIYPEFAAEAPKAERQLHCKLDVRLLRRILDRRAHWNNAEIGAHVSFWRRPNEYEPDLHTILQFLHL